LIYHFIFIFNSDIKSTELNSSKNPSKNIESNSSLEINYELCLECNKPNIWYNLCQQCNARQFQQDSFNWTSGNEFIDKFIQETQLNTIIQALKWIHYDRLKNIEYLDKGGFSIVYKAIWLDGPIKEWSNDEKWIGTKVALKSLNNSLNLGKGFLNEV